MPVAGRKGGGEDVIEVQLCHGAVPVGVIVKLNALTEVEGVGHSAVGVGHGATVKSVASRAKEKVCMALGEQKGVAKRRTDKACLSPIRVEKLRVAR